MSVNMSGSGTVDLGVGVGSYQPGVYVPLNALFLVVNVVFFTLVFGVGISDCTISSNHHNCLLFFLFGATSKR